MQEMHFLLALAIVFTAFKCTVAVDPGRNALGIGFSDILEAAIHKDYGPVIFDGLTKNDCSAGKCLVTVIGTTTCIITTIADPKSRPEDIFRCAPAEEICPCLDCYPVDVIDYCNKWGLCEEQAKAKLFSKVYLGIASESERKKAEDLGYSANFIGAIKN